MKWLETRVPPLVIVGVAGVVMWLAARIAPSLSFPFLGHGFLALVFALLGMEIAVRGILEFRKFRTTVNPMTPGAAARLVRTGIYGRSRHPMYLGFLLALSGLGIYLANLLSLLLLPAFVLYLNRFQIVPEERELSRIFGSEYSEYQKAVRRWL